MKNSMIITFTNPIRKDMRSREFFADSIKELKETKKENTLKMIQDYNFQGEYHLDIAYLQDSKCIEDEELDIVCHNGTIEEINFDDYDIAEEFYSF